MNRTLSLKRETLNDLSTDELSAVNGAGFDYTIVVTACAPLITEVRCALSLTTCIHCG